MPCKHRPLTGDEKARYTRQIAFPGLGEEGQCKLGAATVAVFGAGGLGSPACTYLTMAGVGRLIVIDRDRAELSNLNRQFLHHDRDARIGMEKAVSAEEKLHSLNPNVQVIGKVAEVGKDDPLTLIENADVLLDCLDNYNARMVVNAISIKKGLPLVHAGVEGLSGHLTVVIPGKTPCLGCLLPEKMAQRSRVPVIGVAPGVFGTLQAAEAVKLITGIGEPLAGRMLIGDIATQDWEVLEIMRSPSCNHCGDLPQ
ncbi:MAG: HesA/MoeB/ThiF family protein [Methanomassiliicoccales archaeon]